MSDDYQGVVYLFVYGTLKEGYNNHHYLEDQEFVREAETKPKYRLFDNGLFPMMVEDTDGYSVSGELWAVDEEIIDEIDTHEVLYERKLVKVKGFRQPVYAYIYLHELADCQECYGQWP